MVNAVRVLLQARQWQYRHRRCLAERERLALALWKAEQRLVLSAGAGRTGLFDWDVLRSEMYWTPQFAALIGCTPADPASGPAAHSYRDWADRVHPEDRTRVEQQWRGAMAEQKPWEAEYRVVWPDGTVRWLSSRGEFCYDADANATRMLGVATDATQRMQAAEALRASEQRYRMVADFTYDWELWFDPQGRLVYCSPSCERITGHKPAEFLADPGLLRRRIHPEDIVRFDEHLQFCEQARQPGEGEWRLIRPDGACRWLAHACQPVFDERGQYLGVRSSTRDITDRKRAERELQGLNESLEQRVAERTQTIQMLHDIATLANQAPSTEQAIALSLQQVALCYGWCFGQAWLPAADNADELLLTGVHYAQDPQRFCRFRELTIGVRLRRGQDLPGRVFANGQPQWTTELRRDLVACRAGLAAELQLGTAIAFPIIVGQQIAGVLEFFSDHALQPESRLSDAMVSVGMQLGRVIERADFQEHLLTIAEEIQRGIAQDLHDDVGQELTGLGLKAETLAEMLGVTATPAGRLAADIAVAAERTRGKVRRFSRNMLPLELERGLLAGALGQLAATTTAGSHIACTFAGSQPPQLFDSRVATHLYRIAQEAVSNAVRHSGASQIHIALDQHQGVTELTITDDGAGLASESALAGGMGLRIMHYRAELIGAQLQLGPGPQGGTQVTCRLEANAAELETPVAADRQRPGPRTPGSDAG